jgi:hypothetical protein
MAFFRASSRRNGRTLTLDDIQGIQKNGKEEIMRSQH